MVSEWGSMQTHVVPRAAAHLATVEMRRRQACGQDATRVLEPTEEREIDGEETRKQGS